MTGDDTRATVLVADDEPAYVAAYADWLDDEYDVRTATDGEAALDAFDGSVDVALLDRRMPGLSGDEVLERVRESGFECRVAMITAMEPGVDVVDMPFDEYLTKPVSKDDLLRTVDHLLARTRLDESTRRAFALASKKAALEAAKDRAELEGAPEYRRLRERLEAVQHEADRALEDLMTDGELAAGYYDIGT